MAKRASTARAARGVRHRRVRKRIGGTTQRPRLCVFRSLNHIYAQVIDDVKGHTMAAAGSMDPDIRTQLKGKSKTQVAELVGGLVAKRATGSGASQVVFDRGGFKFHGRVKALAEAARKGGLIF
jgi:large subunit ribosomal protein L18